jgi:hypothetical protein
MRDYKPARRTPEAIVIELDAAERIALFCIASHTSLTEAAGNAAVTRARLIVKGLIDRDGSRLFTTETGTRCARGADRGWAMRKAATAGRSSYSYCLRTARRSRPQGAGAHGHANAATAIAGHI